MNEREIIRKELLNILQGLFGRKEEEKRLEPIVATDLQESYNALCEQLRNAIHNAKWLQACLISLNTIVQEHKNTIFRRDTASYASSLVKNITESHKLLFKELEEMCRILSPSSKIPTLPKKGWYVDNKPEEFQTLYLDCVNYANDVLYWLENAKQKAQELVDAIERYIRRWGGKRTDIIQSTSAIETIYSLTKPKLIDQYKHISQSLESLREHLK